MLSLLRTLYKVAMESSAFEAFTRTLSKSDSETGPRVIRSDDGDLRLFSAKKETLSSIWVWDLLENYRLEELQRIFGLFFQALHSKGALGFSFTHEHFDPNALGSLIRQCGFLVYQEGRANGNDRTVWFAKRP